MPQRVLDLLASWQGNFGRHRNITIWKICHIILCGVFGGNVNGLSLRLSPFYFILCPIGVQVFKFFFFFVCNLFDMFEHCERLIVLFPLYTPSVLGLVLVSIKFLLYIQTHYATNRRTPLDCRLQTNHQLLVYHHHLHQPIQARLEMIRLICEQKIGLCLLWWHLVCAWSIRIYGRQRY